MRCPYCKKDLTLGPPKYYETLEEHVCDPNGTSPLRSTFACWCKEAEGQFWDADGSVYGPCSEFGKIKNAIGSIAEYCDKRERRGRFYRKYKIDGIVRRIHIPWIHLVSLWKYGRLARTKWE